MDAYSPTEEWMMKRLHHSLRENDRRRYAALEASRLGHGGIEYIARLLGCDPKTIRHGIAELEGEDELDPLQPCSTTRQHAAICSGHCGAPP